MTIATDAIRTFKLLGCELLFCTNAADSLRPEAGGRQSGRIERSHQHHAGNADGGLNDERFVSASLAGECLRWEYRALLQKVAKKRVPSTEACSVLSGAEFRTAAEIRMIQIHWGMLLVSVVPEVISAPLRT